MIVERTVYDVKCSKCFKLIARGYSLREDAEKCESECSVLVDNEEHAMCATCERARAFVDGMAAIQKLERVRTMLLNHEEREDIIEEIDRAE